MPSNPAAPMQSLHVHARALGNVAAIDDHVEGVYLISLPVDCGGMAPADVALDVFHASIPVGTLEDFEFSVIDPDTGELLECADEHDSYAGANLGELVERLDAPALSYAEAARPRL